MGNNMVKRKRISQRPAELKLQPLSLNSSVFLSFCNHKPLRFITSIYKAVSPAESSDVSCIDVRYSMILVTYQRYEKS